MLLDVTQQFGADVPGSLAEELRPLAVGPIRALELLAVAGVVAEDQCDQLEPLISATRPARCAL
jgi:hypothetical protein